MKDYFISYNQLDEKWAEWIAWEIESLGFSIVMQKWDFIPGTNFVLEMHSAAINAKRIILVLSNGFLKSNFTGPEWAAFFARDPDGSKRLILPIRIEECSPFGLLSQIVYLDFNKKTKSTCRLLLEQTLLNVEFRNKPKKQISFPGTDIPEGLIAPSFPKKSKQKMSLKVASEDISKSIIQTIINGNAYPFIRKRSTGRAFIRTVLGDYLKHASSDSDTNSEVFSTLQSIIVVDVDGMSGINRKHGIEIGDRVLDVVCHICNEAEQKTIAGRMGDDTVFILLRNCDLQFSTDIADSIVSDINQFDWQSIANDLWVSCSAGVAIFTKKEKSQHFVTRAVEAQMLARREGGNLVKEARAMTDREWERLSS